MDIDTIYNIDCVEGMRGMPDKCVDLVVTSPPYDNLRSYGGSGDGWCLEVFKESAKQIHRVVKDGGVVVWNVNDKTESGSKTGNSFRQCLYFMDIGFNLNDTMIWRKTNPMPQVRQPRYAACFEYMFIFSKGKPKTFNPIMRKTKCGGQRYDSTCKNMGGENGRTEKHFRINEEAVEYNVWDMAIAQNKTGHPAVFPYEMADRHIRSWSNEGDLVLDPFIGSGTTALACVDRKRHFIGFEINEEYFIKAVERVMEKRIKNFEKDVALNR
jgi:site-specific DNA-methyltransferase (adenine-specific)